MESTNDLTPKTGKRVFLIISDIHYDEEKAILAINSHKEADTVLFLGDGYRIFDKISYRYPRTGFIGVRGNCDYDATDAPLSKILSVYGINIYLCHGHHMAVKSGTDALTVTAGANNCHIALFGHTHIPLKSEKAYKNKTVLLFNPGSIGNPPIGKLPSYGLLTVYGDGSFEIRSETL